MNASTRNRRGAPGIEVIQYLRAAAAILVVYYHTLNYSRSSFWPKLGSEGVDVFFVISGFIMAYTTTGQNSTENRWRESIDFMWRRILRVVPLYWIALTLAWRKEIFSGQGNLLTLQDYLFIPHYHQTRSDMIWPHLVPGWTINYEMAFYLVFAFSILAGRYRLLTMLSFLGALALGAWNFGDKTDSVFTEFYGSPIVLEFGFGIILYLAISKHSLHIPQWTLGAMSATAAVIIFLPNQFHRAFADGMPAFILIYGLLQLQSSFRSKTLRLLGDASYSIYIFHLFALEAIEKLIRLSSLYLTIERDFSAILILRLAFAVGVGVLIHLVLEKPLTRFLQQLPTWWSSQARPTAKHQAAAISPGVPPARNHDDQALAGLSVISRHGMSLNDFPEIENPRDPVRAQGGNFLILKR